MYLDRDYQPRRRRRTFLGRLWPLLIVLIVAAVLYEMRPSWLSPRTLEPTPTPTLSVVAFMAEAQGALSRGDFAAALTAYARIAQLEPQNPEPLIAQAWLHLISQDVVASHEAASQAVEVAPENPAALAALARRRGLDGRI